jgi:RNA polymerase sigma-70 factor, ECF subfamily
VYKLVFRFTGNGEAAQELTQEIFFKVYTSINSYSPDAQFFTWLYRIATNHCLNYVRSAKSNPLQHAVDDLDGKKSNVSDLREHLTQLDMLVHEEKSSIVRSALDRLPDRQRMAIVLLRFDGLSYREIAQTLQCSVGAVESLVHRGMETLKQYLAHYVE